LSVYPTRRSRSVRRDKFDKIVGLVTEIFGESACSSVKHRFEARRRCTRELPLGAGCWYASRHDTIIAARTDVRVPKGTRNTMPANESSFLEAWCWSPFILIFPNIGSRLEFRPNGSTD